MKSKIIKFNMDGLNSFVRALDESGKFNVKVGVLGAKVNRKDTAHLTNAEIGAKHEYGSPAENVPVRSFLRMPLQDKADEALDILQHEGLLGMLAQGKIGLIFKLLGVACENVVGQAFETGGFGNWKPLTAFTIERKIQHNPQPLIDTRQLQRSITSRVDQKGAS
jgi:phage gpG-like protein